MNRLTLILWDFGKAFGLLWVFFTATNTGISQSPGNRLSYLDKEDPFYVGLNFPKLTTPQWIGEDGIEAVVTLGIDDMRNHQNYEDFCRPILERLKQIDGRAQLSIFCNTLQHFC